MNATSINEANISDLSQRKSLLIIQAQFQQAVGQQTEAARLFLEAAVLEERLANDFRQAGLDEDAAISFFSAASCYKNAGRMAEAIACSTSALPLTGVSSFAEEVRQFRAECQGTSNPTSHRVIRGIVRNGAVYPFEQGVLSEGQWVTITTA